MSPLAREDSGYSIGGGMGQPRNGSPGPTFPRRQSTLSDVLGENAARDGFFKHSSFVSHHLSAKRRYNVELFI